MLVQLSNCVDFFNKLILAELTPVCKCWAAGGCVRDYFSIGRISADIDLYFPTDEEFEKCKNYFLHTDFIEVDEAQDDGSVKKVKQEKPLATLLFQNDNVIKVKYKGRKFDIIKKLFDSPQATIDAFDFTVCCGAVDSVNVYTHETFFIDLAKKQLMINKLPYPLSTLSRMQRYVQKGYYMCVGEMLKLSQAIGELHTNTEEGMAAAVEEDIMSTTSDKRRFITFD